MTNSIHDKIRKLLALANDTSENGEAEREVAMKMIQKLLIKHRIEMSDVILESDEQVEVTSTTFHFHNAPWIRTIIVGLSKMNFCQYYWTKDFLKGAAYGYHTIIGLPHEIEATIELVKVIFHSCDKEAKVGAKKFIEDKSFKRSFLNAASTKIYYRAMELVTESISHDSEIGTALVVKNAYEVADQRNSEFLENRGTTIKEKKQRTRTKSRNGATQGSKFGSTVSLTLSKKIA